MNHSFLSDAVWHTLELVSSSVRGLCNLNWPNPWQVWGQPFSFGSPSSTLFYWHANKYSMLKNIMRNYDYNSAHDNQLPHIALFEYNFISLALFTINLTEGFTYTQNIAPKPTCLKRVCSLMTLENLIWKTRVLYLTMSAGRTAVSIIICLHTHRTLPWCSTTLSFWSYSFIEGILVVELWFQSWEAEADDLCSLALTQGITSADQKREKITYMHTHMHTLYTLEQTRCSSTPWHILTQFMFAHRVTHRLLTMLDTLPWLLYLWQLF